MQRWILAAGFALILLLGGGYFAHRTIKMNRPHPVWVPLPYREDLEMAKLNEIIKTLKDKLGDPELLARVSKDVGLKSKWNLSSDEECAGELGRRLFVKNGEADTPGGKVPAIHIGVRGKARESAVSGEIAMRLMDDVWKILGIEPPKKKGS